MLELLRTENVSRQRAKIRLSCLSRLWRVAANLASPKKVARYCLANASECSAGIETELNFFHPLSRADGRSKRISTGLVRVW